MVANRRKHGEFTVKSKEILAKRVSHRCSIPTCRQPTSGPGTSKEKAVSIGVAAHIKAASPGGARYDRSMTDEQRRSADNGIWVCQNHGKLIDNDATRYSERLLRKWKRDAEQAAQRELEQPGHRQPGVAPRPSRPWMVFVRSRGAILRHGPGGPPIFFVAQLWFRNEPTSGSPIAESLAGFVTFLQNGIPLFPELRAEWAITNAAGNVAFSQSDETLERLLPVGDIAKLIVMHKRTQDGTAYAWSRGAVEYDGRRHPAHRIEAGQYRLRVRLRGIRVDQIFEFSVSNPGVGANPVIEPTKQSDAVVDDEASAR